MASDEAQNAPVEVTTGAGNEPGPSDHDRDALDVLPLSIVPFKTPALRRARMIKNARLESMVEMFRDETAGSGHVAPQDLERYFAEAGAELDEDLEADLAIVQRLGRLTSFDVYALRIELRRQEIPVNDVSALRLSEEKNRELTVYMKAFTRPLIQQIYGSESSDFGSMEDLVAMFQSPDKDKVLMNIVKMAEKLQIQPGDVPTFLEEYGDVFLSLAFYREIVDKLMVRLEKFGGDMEEILSSQQIRNDPRISDTCMNLDAKFGDIAGFIAGRFESFERNSERLWENINAESFRRTKEIITGHYTTIGGMLCGLQVKMDAWKQRFGNGRGGPLSKADFVMGDFRHGMDVINRLQNNAPPVTID